MALEAGSAPRIGPGTRLGRLGRRLRVHALRINESTVDLGLLAEHLFDGRGGSSPQPFENDVFAGLRLALNDEAGTEALAGIIRDVEGDATAFNIEASRRIGERWKIEIEARAWTGIDRDDPLFALRRDDYAQVTLSHFF